MNPEIQKYITEQRQAGVSDSEITTQLKASGWDEETVQKELKPVTSLGSGHITTKIVIPVLLALVLGGGAYGAIWWWGNQQTAQEAMATFTPRPTASVTTSIALSASPTPQEITNPSNNWKTYTDAQYGIKFTYPLEWTVTDTFNHASGYKPEFLRLIVTNDIPKFSRSYTYDHALGLTIKGPLEIPNNETLEQLLKGDKTGEVSVFLLALNQPGSVGARLIPLVINGHNSYKLELPKGPGGLYEEYFIEKDSKNYFDIVVQFGKKDTPEILDRIVNTFQFIK